MGDFVTHAGFARCSLKTRVRSCDIRAFFFLSCARMLKTENVLSGLVIGRFFEVRFFAELRGRVPVRCSIVLC